LSLSTNPSDIYNDVETAAVTTIQADTYLGNGTTTLSGDINASVTTVPLTSLASCSGKGVVLVGTERIAYTGTTGTSLTGCKRGYRGTTAAVHSSGATVTNYNIVTVHQKIRDLEVGQVYREYELPALAVFAYAMDVTMGDTFGQWDLPIRLYMEITDIVGDLDQVGTMQVALSEMGRLMRYQNDAASGNLGGIADAIEVLGSMLTYRRTGQGGYLLQGILECTITVITTE